MKYLILLAIGAVIFYVFKRYKRFGHLDPLSQKSQYILFNRFGEPLGTVNPNTFMEFFDKLRAEMRIPVLQIAGARRLISPGTAVLAAKKYSLRVTIKIKNEKIMVTKSLFKQELPEEKELEKFVKDRKKSQNFNAYKTRRKQPVDS